MAPSQSTKKSSAEVFTAGVLVDVFDAKTARMRFGDTDELEVSSVVVRSGFARIAPAQSDRKLKIWQMNIIDRGRGIDD